MWVFCVVYEEGSIINEWAVFCDVYEEGSIIN